MSNQSGANEPHPPSVDHAQDDSASSATSPGLDSATSFLTPASNSPSAMAMASNPDHDSAAPGSSQASNPSSGSASGSNQAPNAPTNPDAGFTQAQVDNDRLLAEMLFEEEVRAVREMETRPRIRHRHPRTRDLVQVREGPPPTTVQPPPQVQYEFQLEMDEFKESVFNLFAPLD